jgi:hypothetical protein
MRDVEKTKEQVVADDVRPIKNKIDEFVKT